MDKSRQNTDVRGRFEMDKDYWLTQLADPRITELPTDLARSNEESVPAYLEYSFPPELTDELLRITNHSEPALYMALLAGVYFILQRYTNTEDLIVGAPVFRQKTEGEYLNRLLAFRTQIKAEMTFRDLLFKVKDTVSAALQHQNYPFALLMETLQIPIEQEHFPLSNVMVILENLQDKRYLAGLRSDLLFTFHLSEKGLSGCLEYDAKLFFSSTITQIQGHLLTFFSTAVVDPHCKLSEIALLSEGERQKVLYEFNQTQANFPPEMTAHELFAEQVRQHPEEPALVFQGESVTYRELNQRANWLARHMREQGVQREAIVGLYLEYSLQQIVGLLAILKAGGAYLPIEPNYPLERVRFMLQDSQPKILLTQRNFLEQVSKLNYEGEVLLLDDLAEQCPMGINDRQDLPNLNSSADLAYIIYTSGSTGQPKGVMVEHRGLANLQVYFTQQPGVGVADRILQFASVAFDASVWEIFMALLTGGTLYLISREIIENYLHFEQFLRQNRITVATLPPLYAITMHPDLLPDLRILITAGSATNYTLINKWKDRVHYINAYGPTEGTICASTWEYQENAPNYRTPPIGKPICNTQVYIVDDTNQPLPPLIVGELCIAGVGLARGYLNQPELTAERFVEAPFLLGERIYKTGDLARWLPDGNLEYLGRKDFQVKIRGYRIELGEIECRLLAHPAVQQAAVIDLEDGEGNKDLCAYLVMTESLDFSEIKAYLAEYLPGYMIPAYFVVLPQIPLNASGKVERHALPKPWDGRGARSLYAEPANELEERLALIWCEVFHVAKVSVEDNFFELGGHSIKATQLVTRLYKEMGVELSLEDIFGLATIRNVAEHIAISGQKEMAVIQKAPIAKHYPLSSAQKRLFILDQLEGQSTGYNIPGAISVKGGLEVECLLSTIEKLLSRHESLRTSFQLMEGEPVQVIAPHIEFTLERFSASRELASAQVIREFIRPFSLSKAPLFRVGLIDLEDDLTTQILVFDMHHIISDGVSLNILIQDFARLYAGEALPELPLQYKDFAVWQNEFLHSERLQEEEKYWLASFAGDIPTLSLPTDYPRPAVMSYAGDTFNCVIDGGLQQRLNHLASLHGVTLYMLLLAAYNMLLAKYTGQGDIVIGSPILGRSRHELENIIGVFINTLALRNFPVGDKTFIEFLHEVRANSLQAFDHQNYQFDMLVEKLELTRDLSRNPLFDTMLTMQNMEINTSELQGLSFTPVEIKSGTAKFDLELIVAEVSDGINLHIEYSTQLFKEETVARFAAHFLNLLNAICANPGACIADLEILSAEEKWQLIYGFNDTEADFSRDRSIYQLFEEHAAKTPDRIALIFSGQEITYAELNKRANQLAHVLRKCGLTADQLVGVLQERTPLMVESILAIWKAGGGYIPIDPAYPLERISGILNDSGAQIVLTFEPHAERYASLDYHGKMINLASADLQIREEGMENLNLAQDMQGLAYVIYTSGSTGKPKGAMVEHIGMMNHIQAKVSDLRLGAHSIVAQNASHCFDISVWQFFLALTLGGATVIYPNELTLQPESFIDRVIADRVTTLEVVPSFLSVILDELEERPRKFPTLEHLLVTGETVKPNLVKRWFNLYPAIKMINAYGPTEASDDITHYIMESLPATPSISIGRPVQNFHIYMVDQYLKLVPVGVKGEICVSGVGVGRGYLNDPARTARVFMDDPFVGESGVRLYKTGDLGRWLPDGLIEFFGRKDYQVKIRGFRIELGEIESKLTSHPWVKEAVVIERDDLNGNKYLAAYIVFSSEAMTGRDTEILTFEQTGVIREYLLQSLPDYMVPAYYIGLSALPLNPNGKVDRKALPEPESSLVTSAEYTPPQSEIEEILVTVWAEVLGLAKVSIYDNFFMLGGDSIKAIQIAARLQKYHLKLEIKDLFQHPEIAELARYVTPLLRKIEQSAVSGTIPLTPIQRWFFEQEFSQQHHYNQAIMLKSDWGFDEAVVREVFQKIIEHHDVLRIVFRLQGTSNELATAEVIQASYGKIIQKNRGLETGTQFFSLETLNFKAMDNFQETVEKEARRVQAGLDLVNGPLVKLALFKTPAGDHLLIVIHHLIIDGVSWRILLEDFATGYQQVLAQQPVVFPEKTDSFKVWSEALEIYANSPELLQEKDYWLMNEARARGITSLLKNARVSMISNSKNTRQLSHTLTLTMDKTITEKLLKNVNYAYNTEIDDILLTALALTLQAWVHTSKIAIMLESHGREDIIPDLVITRTIGWFATQYPIVLELGEARGVDYQIRVVKETLRRIPKKGTGYGILRYLTSRENKQELQFQLKPEIGFNYLGQVDRDAEIAPGLFGMSNFHPGEPVSPHAEREYALEINALVSNEQLSVHFDYNRIWFDAEMIENLLELFRLNLQALVEHCTQLTETVLTPSDVDDEEVSIEQLDELADFLNSLE